MSSSDFDFLLVFDSLAESRARISELMYMLYPTHACGERCRSFTRVEPAPVVAEGAPFGDGPGVQDSQPPEALLPLIELLGETTSRIDQMLICRVRESRPPPHVIETLKRLMKARWQLDQAYLDLWADAEGRQVDGSGPPPRG
jgi:hypothetical protein